MTKAAPGSEREMRRRRAISDAARRMREGEGFLYVAEVIGTENIKIGYALDLEKRRKSLRQDYFKEFKMVASAPATIMDEKALHFTLRKLCIPRMVGTKRCPSEFYHRSVLSHWAIPAELRCAA